MTIGKRNFMDSTNQQGKKTSRGFSQKCPRDG
jgi:hypothetical protein